MIPVRTRASNFVYRGPTPDIGDAWVERRPRERVVYLTWEPTTEEREAIAGGALLELGIHGMEPIPPVSLGVSERRQISAIGAAIRDRARKALEELGVGSPFSIPAGHWLVSTDVWEDVQVTEALDPDDGVPTLLGRPLMEVPGADRGTLEYAVAIDARPPGPPDAPRRQHPEPMG